MSYLLPNCREQFDTIGFNPALKDATNDLLTPPTSVHPTLKPGEVFLIASGDSRLSVNQTCWPAQTDMERQIIAMLAAEGVTVNRAHPYDEALKHDLSWNQRMGIDVFKSIPR